MSDAIFEYKFLVDSQTFNNKDQVTQAITEGLRKQNLFIEVVTGTENSYRIVRNGNSDSPAPITGSPEKPETGVSDRLRHLAHKVATRPEVPEQNVNVEVNINIEDIKQKLKDRVKSNKEEKEKTTEKLKKKVTNK
ncbi:MAG: hypothetical protein GY858_05540 [Candidatus Omnitrophica bacterium]|nr:hypothetical protein [Candidatus Omnitrophota bacterium]